MGTIGGVASVEGVRRPWLPSGLETLGWTQQTVEELRVAVVDEMSGGDVGVSLTAWPWADELGRVRFDLTSEVEVALTESELRGHLYRGRGRRAPRIGDVFGVRLAPGTVVREHEDDWRGKLDQIVIEAYDISAEVRMVSKLAFYARVAAVIDHEEAKKNGQLPLVDEPTEGSAIRSLLAAPEGGAG